MIHTTSQPTYIALLQTGGSCCWSRRDTVFWCFIQPSVPLQHLVYSISLALCVLNTPNPRNTRQSVPGTNFDSDKIGVWDVADSINDNDQHSAPTH